MWNKFHTWFTRNHDNNCWDFSSFSEPAHLRFCGLCPLRYSCFHGRGGVAALPLKGARRLPAAGTSTTNFPIILVGRGSQENPLPIVTKSGTQWITGWALSLQLSRRLSSQKCHMKVTILEPYTKHRGGFWRTCSCEAATERLPHMRCKFKTG